MGTDAQESGEVGMDEVIQADSEIVPGGSVEGATSGEISTEEEGTGKTAPVDQDGVAFYNAKDVPEELRSTFQEMQKAFTQKTQNLSSQVKQAESSQYHAKLFRELMADSRVVTYLEELERTGGGVGSQGAEQSIGGNSSEDANVDPQVTELRRQVQQLQASMNLTRQKMQVSDEKSAFTTSHPDWEQYKGGMDKAWEEDKSRSYSDAYNWAFRQSYLAKKASLQRQRTRAQAGVERSGPVTGTKQTHRIDSFQDALRASLDELGMSRETFGI